MAEQRSTKRPGRLVLVTGSTRGIGLGIAEHLVRSGSRVVLHGRDRERVALAEARAGGAGLAGTVVGGVVADLTVPERVREVAEETLARWGVPDGLVLNAGAASCRPAPSRT